MLAPPLSRGMWVGLPYHLHPGFPALLSTSTHRCPSPPQRDVGQFIHVLQPQPPSRAWRHRLLMMTQRPPSPPPTRNEGRQTQWQEVEPNAGESGGWHHDEEGGNEAKEEGRDNEKTSGVSHENGLWRESWPVFHSSISSFPPTNSLHPWKAEMTPTTANGCPTTTNPTGRANATSRPPQLAQQPAMTHPTMWTPLGRGDPNASIQWDRGAQRGQVEFSGKSNPTAAIRNQPQQVGHKMEHIAHAFPHETMCRTLTTRCGTQRQHVGSNDGM